MSSKNLFIFIKNIFTKTKLSYFSSMGYNSHIFESRLLVSFSIENSLNPIGQTCGGLDQ
jgi:hypothetical protein